MEELEGELNKEMQEGNTKNRTEVGRRNYRVEKSEERINRKRQIQTDNSERKNEKTRNECGKNQTN